MNSIQGPKLFSMRNDKRKVSLLAAHVCLRVLFIQKLNLIKSMSCNSFKPPAVLFVEDFGRTFYRRENASYVSSHPIQIVIV